MAEDPKVKTREIEKTVGAHLAVKEEKSCSIILDVESLDRMSFSASSEVVCLQEAPTVAKKCIERGEHDRGCFTTGFGRGRGLKKCNDNLVCIDTGEERHLPRKRIGHLSRGR